MIRPRRRSTPRSFAAEGNDLALDLNALHGSKEAGAYPLVLATYEIVCSKGYDADTAAAVKSFVTVSANDGQANLSAAGYIPLPDTFKERLLKSVGPSGRTLDVAPTSRQASLRAQQTTTQTDSAAKSDRG